MAQKIIQFRLKTLLLIVSFVAMFLSWRVWQPDGGAASAIENVGGTVFYQYQSPTVHDPGIISQFVSPDHLNLYPSELRCERSQQTRTVSEFLFRPKSEECIAAVKIPHNEVTPEILNSLEKLKLLKIVYLDKIGWDNESEQCYLDVRRRFPNRLWPKEMNDSF